MVCGGIEELDKIMVWLMEWLGMLQMWATGNWTTLTTCQFGWLCDGIDM